MWSSLISISGQIPGGRLAEIYSAKIVFLVSVLLNILPCLLSPFLAKIHFQALIVARLIQGRHRIYVNKVLFVCLFVRNFFLYNCHDYPRLSSNFYHQGETTNSVTFFCVMINQILVQIYAIPPGENNNGATLPVSQLEQGGAWLHWSSSISIYLIYT